MRARRPVRCPSAKQPYGMGAAVPFRPLHCVRIAIARPALFPICLGQGWALEGDQIVSTLPKLQNHTHIHTTARFLDTRKHGPKRPMHASCT